VRLILDTNVWIEHLRRDVLTPLLPGLRGRFQLSMDALVAAELLAGCRLRRERQLVDGLIAPFERAGRLQAPTAAELAEAGRALSKLRERGVALSNPAGALIDATIAVTTVRSGALLVTDNARDFEKLASVLPLRWETLVALRGQLDRPD
jgi:predicted nucleic acid-binding protein